MLAVPLDLAPVLVVGAGPTGLAAALSLARAQVPVRIIDAAPRPGRFSRAIGIQARTLELFEQHRIVEPFLALGHRARLAHLHSGGRRIAALDFDPLQTRYPYLLLLDQTDTERILTEQLAERGVMIERSVTLTHCRQEGDTTRVSLRHGDGREEPVEPPYLIAADGAHSTVRHQLGAGFVGQAFEQTFLLADFCAAPDWPDDEIHLFATHDGLAAMLPLGAGRYRLVADRPPGSGKRNAGEAAAPGAGAAPHAVAAPTLETCREIVRTRVDAELAIDELAWSSYFHLSNRMVEQLRLGRVLFAGDAAHVHSPAGAQGMNTGIQEAFNLGWKLARVLKAGAPARLLDSYHVERHPIERDVLRQTNFITQVVEADRGPLKLLREHLVPVLASLGPVRDALRRSVSELAVQYRKSPLTLERVLDGGPRAGERAPDALLRVHDGPLGQAPGVARLFDLHDPAHFTLLTIEAPGQAAEGDRDARELAAALDRLMPGAIRHWRVTDADEPGAPPLGDAYGHTRPSFYLLRPDGYIAARGRPGSDANALLRHCEAWFATVNRHA
ncbi:FAD-dependent monooxygenase [Burkholderia glumae]|uniref:FAD-dependent monooxygenase n=2 Tax=Burkholderia glumae TaxID=337 RepID=A0AAQ0BU48_BURGL|nr:FAD-dependent monooxygenase [Burkholderia glumae]ACR28039.1 FAD-dependent oxidoreductase [Burkholderia glumae BGR1]AJY67267.1 FAD dependent oxidoreductase family protein [Burkholderia glumae LMG 2196 = ATCC 33617]KHJ61304.1 FAD-binding monooxygenase [Burkholderia glumae]MCM2537347.1 FAD-dependent monooxygenase [Burkholderia glumae]MCM2550122.1 FAD-dependent monooxygenase [Burkholderia glumae]